MRFLISLIIIAIGILVTIKSEKILNFFGYSDWAETKFRMWGGSRGMYKLFGIILILGGILYMTGMIESILLAIFAPTIK